ncbi:DUF4192 domain-containing protein [Nocardia xishanensis]|uniref:DUF4192 domain-containing protein n=1 Tax=Nocardia xishanensis TaxID=238964 RepID=UPI000A817A98|nr:DUF4192 domain-containing protein [Nocardia xishanensis]
MADNTDDAQPPTVDEATASPDTPRERGPGPRLRVDDPGELIAALPALIEFVPERSLVAVLLRRPTAPGSGPTIGPALRFDLDQDGGKRGLAAAIASAVAGICAAEDATEVLAVIIDDRMQAPRRPRTPGGAKAWGALIAAFALHLADDEVTLTDAWAVPVIQARQRWWSLLDTDHQGTLPDPTTSMVTFAYVLNGRPIYRTRSQLTDMVAHDRDSAQEVAAHLEDAAGCDRYVAAIRRADPDGYRRRALERVLYRVADLDSGAVPTARQMAELAVVLRDRMVRDALLALAVGEHATVAEQLWVTLVQSLPGHDRAEAAVLLAYSAYVRGDGPLAGIALGAALETDPSHSMAILLDTALRSGMRPQELRRLADHGLGIAGHLGVDLGPIRW